MLKPELPEGIGPHEGRELELMLAGEKPLAMFSDIVTPNYQWPDKLFERHVTSGKIVKKEFETVTSDGKFKIRHLYYALPGETWRIKKAHELSLLHFDGVSDESIDASIQIGRLLGYKEEDIQTFIRWINLNRAARQQ